jgi:hypothetical protein
MLILLLGDTTLGKVLLLDMLSLTQTINLHWQNTMLLEVELTLLRLYLELWQQPQHLLKLLPSSHSIGLPSARLGLIAVQLSALAIVLFTMPCNIRLQMRPPGTSSLHSLTLILYLSHCPCQVEVYLTYQRTTTELFHRTGAVCLQPLSPLLHML